MIFWRAPATRSSRLLHPLTETTMSLNDTLFTVFGGIFAVLAVASLIGATLKFRLSPAAPHKVIDNLNARLKAWWAMIALIGGAIWIGKGGIIAVFLFIS